MKLTIKAGDIELQYEDEYTMLEEEAKNRIESILKTIYAMQPPTIVTSPITGTVEEIFSNRK